MSLPVANAAEVPESLTGRPGRPSGDFSMPKPLEKMNSEERSEWLRGDGGSKSWSESSLSAFEVPDAPEDSADKAEVKTVEGDVTTVAKGERKGDPEGSEDAPSSESEKLERHTKAYNDLPVRLARELSSEYEEAHKAGGNIPVSREVGEFIQHVLADSKNPGKIYTHLCKNPQLVRNFHNMSGQSILAIMEDIDQKVSVAAPESKRVTKAPPPAREVGGRGSSSGDDEKTAISQGDFRSFRRAANAKAVARARLK
jgi:hypothetical protein